MKIVGISACPAGLAHTPMAAKALEAGQALGYDVNGTRGSMGQVNTITDEEAKARDLVITLHRTRNAAWNVSLGKKVIRVDINICIKAPEAVLKKCKIGCKQN